MLHLRVISPTDLTGEVLRRLRDERGTAHVTLLRGAAVQPAGDLVQADVARESIDSVLSGLCALGVDRRGGITLEPLDTVLSDASDVAEEAAPGDGADAVVWDELLARTGDDSRATGTFLAFLVLACLLAVVGVVTDSSVTVVGAMVVGPEFGPLAAVAVGLVLRRPALVRQAAVALAVGFPLAMGVALVGALLGEWTGLIAVESIGAGGEVDFIYQVGPFSLIVALLAGAAGMLSLTSARSAVLVGVFISVTTVPAAAYAVVAATAGQWATSAESALQLLVNLVGIVLAAALVLLVRVRRDASTLRRPLTAGRPRPPSAGVPGG